MIYVQVEIAVEVWSSCSVIYSIFVPTRDSSRWISIFLSAYRDLGIEPLYVVDERSCDGTADILEAQGARVVTFLPSGDFVEAGLIEFGSRAAGTPWVLRMDDDEFPSLALLQAIPDLIKKTRNAAFDIPRLELFRRGGEIYQSRARGRLHGGTKLPSLQRRLYRPGALTFHQRIHSSGFEGPPFCGIMRSDQYFIHFDRLIRSPRERVAKMHSQLKSGYPAYQLADEYLPELFSLEHHAAIKPDLREVRRILEALPDPDETMPEFSDKIVSAMRDAARKYGDQQFECLRTVDADFIIRLSHWIPPFMLTRVAELLCTIGIKGPGSRLWNFAASLKEARAWE